MQSGVPDVTLGARTAHDVPEECHAGTIARVYDGTVDPRTSAALLIYCVRAGNTRTGSYDLESTRLVNMTTWKWNTAEASFAASSGPTWTYSETFAIPQGSSIQRVITSGGVTLANNDGWSIVDGNPCYASYFIDYRVTLYRTLGVTSQLVRRWSGAAPNVNGHNGISHVIAQVSWLFEPYVFDVDIDARQRSDGTNTRIWFDLTIAPLGIDDGYDYANRALRAGLWMQWLTSTP